VNAYRNPLVRRPFGRFKLFRVPHRFENLDAALVAPGEPIHVKRHSGNLGNGLNKIYIVNSEFPRLGGINPQGSDNLTVDRNGYGQNGGDSFVLIYHLPVRFKGVFLNGVSEAEYLKDSRFPSLDTQIIEINCWCGSAFYTLRIIGCFKPDLFLADDPPNRIVLFAAHALINMGQFLFSNDIVVFCIHARLLGILD